MFIELIPPAKENRYFAGATKSLYVRADSIHAVWSEEDGGLTVVSTVAGTFGTLTPVDVLLARIEAAEAASAPQLPDFGGILGSVMGIGAQEEGETE